MKLRIALLAALLLFAPSKSYCYPVALPPDNLVQNPYFGLSYTGPNITDWSGSWAALELGWPSMPNDNGVMDQDVYQNIPTAPGQLYSVSFYGAADLYVGQSVTIDLDINGQVASSWTTPPYQLNGGNRIDSMHWQNFTYTFYATGSSTELEFVDANTYDFGLTSISMVPVPEPTAPGLLAAGTVLGLAICYRSGRRVNSV